MPSIRALLFVGADLTGRPGDDTLRGSYNTIRIDTLPTTVEAEIHVAIGHLQAGMHRVAVRVRQGIRELGSALHEVSESKVHDGGCELEVVLQLVIQSQDPVRAEVLVDDEPIGHVEMDVLVESSGDGPPVV